jgi:hypothetical protein
MTGKKRHALVIPAVPLVIRAVPFVIRASVLSPPVVFRLPLVIPAVPFVIPAEAGIQVTARTGWIPAPHFRGDKFTPAEAVAGMTEGKGNDSSRIIVRPL